MESYHFRAMNTEISLAAEGQAVELELGFAQARKFITASERRFTRFSSESELSQLNRSAGSWFQASPDLFEVLCLAREYVELTQGLFDPTLLRDLERIGYDRSLELIHAEAVFSVPSPSPRRPLPFDGLSLRPDEGLIYLPPGLALDLGGLAKGWIAEQAARRLAEYSPTCGVNAGGDLYLIGLPENTSSWPIALGDPQDPAEVLTVLNLPPGGVATSSVTKRVWKQGQKQRHHLLDPRTGEPAETDWLSVIVSGAHTGLCEALAKALLIAGAAEAENLAYKAGVDFIAVDRQGQLLGTQKSLEYLHD